MGPSDTSVREFDEMSLTMSNDSPAVVPVQLPSPPQQPLPSSVSVVIKESGAPVETR